METIVTGVALAVAAIRTCTKYKTICCYDFAHLCVREDCCVTLAIHIDVIAEYEVTAPL